MSGTPVTKQQTIFGSIGFGFGPSKSQHVVCAKLNNWFYLRRAIAGYIGAGLYRTAAAADFTDSTAFFLHPSACSVIFHP
jgi:hypothetical protein